MFIVLGFGVGASALISGPRAFALGGTAVVLLCIVAIGFAAVGARMIYQSNGGVAVSPGSGSDERPETGPQERNSVTVHLAELGWSVWRQDDSGTRSVVATNLSEDQAKSMVSDFESKGHKQTYWCTSP